MPLISVVMIFLNSDRFLGEAVESVLAQTLQDWELVLVDDGSTDRSTEIAMDFARQDSRIRYIDHPGHSNRGMSASRNLGAHSTSGPYLAFMDSDDVWMRDRLDCLRAILRDRPEVALVFDTLYHWHSWDPAARRQDHVVVAPHLSDRVVRPPEASLALFPLAPTLNVVAQNFLVRRQAFAAVGGFEERFRSLFEDQAFFAKIYLHYPVFFSSGCWMKYRQHSASCVAATRKEGNKDVFFNDFLDWLENYVERLPSADRRVLRAISQARRCLRRTRWDRALMLPYRLRNRLSGAQVRRVTIPDPNPGDGARP